MTKEAILKEFRKRFVASSGYPRFAGNVTTAKVEKFLLSALDEVERETYKTGVNNALHLISACYSPQSGNWNEEVQKDIKRAREILLSPSSEKLPKEGHE